MTTPLVEELRGIIEQIVTAKGENRLTDLLGRSATALEAMDGTLGRYRDLLRDYEKTIVGLRENVAEFTCVVENDRLVRIARAAEHLVAQRGADNIKQAFGELAKAVEKVDG